jgi:hypothetical protein
VLDKVPCCNRNYGRQFLRVILEMPFSTSPLFTSQIDQHAFRHG